MNPPIEFQKRRNALLEAHHQAISPLWAQFCDEWGGFQGSDYPKFLVDAAPYFAQLEAKMTALKQAHGIKW